MDLNRTQRLSCLAALPFMMLVACKGSSPLSDAEVDILARYELTFSSPRLARCVAHLLRDRGVQSLDEIREISCTADSRSIYGYGPDILNDENRDEQGNLLSAVQDVSGLEKFKQLEVLSLKENLIRSIDLSELRNLRRLDLSTNLIESLDLRNNTKLEYLNLSENPMTSVNVQGLSALQYLDLTGGSSVLDSESVHSMGHPELIGVNFSNFDGKVSLAGLEDLTSLSELKIASRPQTVEEFSPLHALVSVDLGYSGYGFLDFSHNEDLKQVEARGNVLDGIELSNSAVLDLLSVSYSNFGTIEHLLRQTKTLAIIGSTINDTGHLDLTNPDNVVESLTISSSGISSIEIRAQAHLKHLNVANNLLSSVDISGAPNLQSLDVARNGLIETLVPVPAGAEVHGALKELLAYENRFADIDVGRLPNLTRLSIDRNTAIKEIDLTDNSKLTRLDARLLENLETISFPEVSVLMRVNLAGGSLNSLDITQQTELQFLNVDDNGLTELDISSNTKLRELRLRNNNLSMLDASAQADSGSGSFLGLCGNDSFLAGDVAMLVDAFELVSLPAHLGDTGSAECVLVKAGSNGIVPSAE